MSKVNLIIDEKEMEALQFDFNKWMENKEVDIVVKDDYTINDDKEHIVINIKLVVGSIVKLKVMLDSKGKPAKLIKDYSNPRCCCTVADKFDKLGCMKFIELNNIWLENYSNKPSSEIDVNSLKFLQERIKLSAH